MSRLHAPSDSHSSMGDSEDIRAQEAGKSSGIWKSLKRKTHVVVAAIAMTFAGAGEVQAQQAKKEKERIERIVTKISMGTVAKEDEVRDLYYNSSPEIFEASLHLYLARGNPQAAGELMAVLLRDQEVALALRLSCEKHLVQAAKKHPGVVRYLVSEALPHGYEKGLIAARILGDAGLPALPQVHEALEGRTEPPSKEKFTDAQVGYLSTGAGEALRRMFRLSDEKLDAELVGLLAGTLRKNPARDKSVPAALRERSAELLFYRPAGFAAIVQAAKDDPEIAVSAVKAVSRELLAAPPGEFLPLNNPARIAGQWKRLLADLRSANPAVQEQVTPLLERLENEEQAAINRLKALGKDLPNK